MTVYEGLGVFHAALYSLRGKPRHLDRAIKYLGRAVEGARPDPLVLAALGNGLWMRYERFGDPADLDAAIRHGRRSVDVAENDDRRAGYLADLAAPQLARFLLTGDHDDVEQAIAVTSEAIRRTRDRKVQAIALANFAQARLYRYEHTADRADVLASVDAARESVNLTGPRELSYAVRLHILATALISRFEHTDDLRDLDDAIARCREAVRARRALDHRGALYLNTLCIASRLRFAHIGDPSDLDDAVAAGEEAAGAATDDRERATVQGNLAPALWLRSRLTGDERDLTRAVELAEQSMPAEGANRPMALHNLSMMLASREEFGRAESLAEQALAEMGESHPFRVQLLTRLAGLQLHRPDGLEPALANLRAAVTAAGPALTMQHAVQAATDLGEVAARHGHTADALTGYARVVDLLPLAAWPGLSREVREERLTKATEALGAAAALADPAEAVRLLEVGRAVMWSQQLDLHTDLAALRAKDPTLADRLDEIRRQLDALNPDVVA